MGSIGVRKSKRPYALHMEQTECESGFSLVGIKYHSATQMGKDIYIIGGRSKLKEQPAFVENTCVYTLNISKNKWSVLPTVGLPPRSGHLAFSRADQVYIFAGFGEAGHSNDLYQLDTLLLKWTLISSYGKLPTVRTFACGEFIEPIDQFFVFGGVGVTGRRNDVNCLVLQNHHWFKPQSKGQPPSPRLCSSSCTQGLKVYVFGGKAGQRCYGDLYVCTFINKRALVWSQLAEQPSLIPAGRGRAAASMSLLADRLVVFGGFQPNAKRISTQFYSIRENRWVGSAHIEGPATYSHAALKNGEKILIIGGEGATMNYWRLEATPDS